MTLPSSNELREQITSDSKKHQAALTDTRDREIKPLLVLFSIFCAAILVIQYSNPSLEGAVLATIFCIILNIMLIWFLKVEHEIAEEDKFQERIKRITRS